MRVDSYQTRTGGTNEEKKYLLPGKILGTLRPNVTDVLHLDMKLSDLTLLVLAKHSFKQWQKPDRPAVDRRMVDKHASLLHHFFQMAIAQQIGRLPTDAHPSHIDWEPHIFGSQHLTSSLFSQNHQHSRVVCLAVNATKP